MNSKLKAILRWILFLPAGILAGGIVQQIYPFLVGYRYEVTNFGVLFASFIAGCATAYVCAFIIPLKNKSWITFPLVILSLLDLLHLLYFNPELYYGLIKFLQFLGISVIAYNIHKENITFEW